MPSSSSIKHSGTPAIALLTLNRPARLNSFNDEMRMALRDALDELSQSASLRCLVITGAGRAFSTGQDLAEREAVLRGEDVDLGAALEEGFNRIASTIRNMSVPVICAVNGIAAGAGANLALCADIVVAARSASFVQSFSNIGLIPDTGGTWLLPRLVGLSRASALAMLGEAVSAEEAERIGLIWKYVPDDELAAFAMNLAERLAARSSSALSHIKRALQNSQSNSFANQLELERDLQREAGRTADYREGVAAFLEKRAPRFDRDT